MFPSVSYLTETQTNFLWIFFVLGLSCWDFLHMSGHPCFSILAFSQPRTNGMLCANWGFLIGGLIVWLITRKNSYWKLALWSCPARRWRWVPFFLLLSYVDRGLGIMLTIKYPDFQVFSLSSTLGLILYPHTSLTAPIQYPNRMILQSHA